MKEEVCREVIKKRYMKELEGLFNDNYYIGHIIWKDAIAIKKIRSRELYERYDICNEVAYILIEDKTIEVHDKEVYETLKSFGEKHNFETLIKCWDELVDEHE